MRHFQVRLKGPPMKKLRHFTHRAEDRPLSPEGPSVPGKKKRVSMASSPSSSPWPCSRCTFINPPSRLLSCQVCFSSSPPSPAAASSTSSPPRWSCTACTFHNPARRGSCEMCGTKPAFKPNTIVIDGEEGSSLIPVVNLPVGSSGGSVFGLRSCGDKRDLDAVISGEDIRRRQKSARKETDPIFVPLLSDIQEKGISPSKQEKGNAELLERSTSKTYKILSYNVWFREDLQLEERMNAIGNLIWQHSPDIICLQEVTPNIYKLFQASSWWKDYECSVPGKMAAERSYFCMQLSKLPVKAFSCKPFSNSIMGRELCIADIDTGTKDTLVIATSHLESPCPGPPKWDQMYSKERVAQAKESLRMLDESSTVVFCGDMNWDDQLDGKFPVPASWFDAWTELKPGKDGWTYDTKSNPMLSENRKLQKRLDRFICKLPGFKIIGIDMIGLESIPSLSYSKEKRVRGEMKNLVLPVLPSDHYGLLLTIQSK